MAAAIETGSLHQRTLQLLKSCNKSLPLIYKEAGIPFYWLKKFSADEIKNPSVNRVQKLYEYLTDAKLPV